MTNPIYPPEKSIEPPDEPEFSDDIQAYAEQQVLEKEIAEGSPALEKWLYETGRTHLWESGEELSDEIKAEYYEWRCLQLDFVTKVCEFLEGA